MNFLRHIVTWSNFTDFVIRSKRKILNRNAEQQTDLFMHSWLPQTFPALSKLADFSLMKLKHQGPEKYEMSDVVAAASLSLQPSFPFGY